MGKSESQKMVQKAMPFLNLVKSQSPSYLFDEIPPERQLNYGLRHPHDYEVHVARTNRFSNTYFHNTLFEWNLLGDEIKDSISLFSLRTNC